MAKLEINGKAVDVDATPDTPLLYVLRDDLKMNAAKFGCGLGQCGACTVLVDNQPVFSCVVPVSVLEGRRKITTHRRASAPRSTSPARLQRAFIEEQAAQCGYCTAGIDRCGPRRYCARSQASRATPLIRERHVGQACAVAARTTASLRR